MPTQQQYSTSASTECPPPPSEAVTSRQATLDDLEGIRACVKRLAESRFSQFLTVTKQEAENWLINSLQFPQQVGLLVVDYQSTVCGIAAMMAVDVPQGAILGVGSAGIRHGFIHSCYIDPYLPVGRGGTHSISIPPSVGKVMMAAIEEWAKVRGATYVYGNMRTEGHFEALFKKHGMQKIHLVVGKELK